MLTQLARSNTDIQSYYYNNRQIQIPKPVLGSLLTKINLKTSETSSYVVIKIFTKKKGINKDIIHLIFLEKVVEITSTHVTYQSSSFPMILKLTNHGEWCSSKMKHEFKYLWDFYVPNSL